MKARTLADALELLVDGCGGIFSYAQRTAYLATLQALTRGQTRVTRTEVDVAQADLRSEFERTLASADYPVLDAVESSGEGDADDATLALLHGGHLLELRNADRWCAAHPLLLPTLRRWRERQGGAG